QSLLRFLIRPPMGYIIIVIAIVAILYWQLATLTSWANSTWKLFGWGLILVAVAVVTLIWLAWRRKLSSLIYRWNQWLAGIACVVAAWGILALFDLGGDIGFAIIGFPDLMGALRIAGLFVLSAVLVAPRPSLQFVFIIVESIARSIAWLWKQPRKLTAPRLISKERPIPPEIKATQKAPDKVIQPKEAIPVLTPAAATARVSTPTRQETKQVAQEVWKKYGESASVTIDGWRLPPIGILDKSAEVQFGEADNMQRAKLIEDALASYGVEAKVVQINTGPTVTQFGVEPGWDRKMKEVKERDKEGNTTVKAKEVSKTRVKVERITSLANDLALALAAPSIRIEAPVPGQSVVGIEVPNVVSSVVSLRGVIETSTFQKTEAKSNLALALGKGAGGEAGVGDLGKMPHLLIAGATGSGKTVCLNATIICLLMHNTPYDIRLIMIDPKRVELTPFNSIPHLAVPVIVNTDKALEALRWLNHEMDQRYQQLARAGARNIESYNKNKQGNEKLPYLILVIDELADVMMAGFDEVEHILCRLAQLARATGIHLIVATQRPSVDVVTGLIKANFPTRISFAVTSQVDSRTILDSGGAEKLLGRGDMLYMPTEASKPKRLQGSFVSDAETERLVYFWASQKIEELAPLKIEESLQAPSSSRRRGLVKDPLLEAAKKLAEEHEHISTSFLQRRLQIGYPRAARLKEQLDEEMAQAEETQEEEITE
ncbi:MAG TPA: DNA translocase FtsK, partial [Dehalococcoidia bacterium]|nr:DNA translocase FtsK [Dehalococcoidia bacterium]